MFHLYLFAFSVVLCNILCSPISISQHGSAQQTSCVLKRMGPPLVLLISVILQTRQSSLSRSRDSGIAVIFYLRKYLVLVHKQSQSPFLFLYMASESQNRNLIDCSGSLPHRQKQNPRASFLFGRTAASYISNWKCTGKCSGVINVSAEISIYFLIPVCLKELLLNRSLPP